MNKKKQFEEGVIRVIARTNDEIGTHSAISTFRSIYNAAKSLNFDSAKIFDAIKTQRKYKGSFWARIANRSV